MSHGLVLASQPPCLVRLVRVPHGPVRVHRREVSRLAELGPWQTVLEEGARVRLRFVRRCTGNQSPTLSDRIMEVLAMFVMQMKCLP